MKSSRNDTDVLVFEDFVSQVVPVIVSFHIRTLHMRLQSQYTAVSDNVQIISGIAKS